MGEMALGHGSEFHLLRWLGRHRTLFNNKVKIETGIENIEWLDFNFNNSKTIPDEEIYGLDFCKNEMLISKFRQEWPQSGNSMNWDLVGYAEKQKTWVLCEAKAHIGELISKCGATSDKSIRMIKQAMKITKEYFRVESNADWLQNYYQMANRIYCLGLFKRYELNVVLLNIYFVGDLIQSQGNIRRSPQVISEWKKSISEMYEYLGIERKPKEIKELFLMVSE